MTEKDWVMLRVLFPYVSFDCKIGNTEQIKDVVKKTAYRDMMPRTLKGIGTAKNKKGELCKEKMLDYACTRIISYLNAPVPKAFDEYTAWHRETCDEIVSIFCDTDVNLTYGKAQKLINIAFKNLLLFKDANEELFTYCHTPIDNNVLRICREEAKIDCIRENWSGIDDYDYYLELQIKIKEYLNSNDNKYFRLENNKPATNLIFDFFAWIKGGGKRNLETYWANIVDKSEFYTHNEELIKSILASI